MATKIKSWAVQKAKDPLAEYTWDAPALKENEVDVKIKACGVCRSDVDAVDGVYDAWGLYHYPIVTGHEGVGEVVEVGSEVKHLKVGQLVGLGVFRNCCETCTSCINGKTNLCLSTTMMFAQGNRGCLSEHVRIKAKFAFAIPEGIPFEYAGPLMCAGTTVFSPFREHNIQPGQHVGVIGIGGLGHLAIQIAKAYGCVVTAFSSSSDKETEARHFGAHHFVNTSEASPKVEKNSIDFLLMTAGGMRGINWDFFFSVLAPNATFIFMGAASHEPIPVPLQSLIMGQRRVAGSAAGSVAHTTDMLKFCAAHKIRPQIETFPVSKINEAFEKTRQGNVRYRAVILF